MPWFRTDPATWPKKPASAAERKPRDLDVPAYDSPDAWLNGPAGPPTTEFPSMFITRTGYRPDNANYDQFPVAVAHILAYLPREQFDSSLPAGTNTRVFLPGVHINVVETVDKITRLINLEEERQRLLAQARLAVHMNTLQ